MVAWSRDDHDGRGIAENSHGTVHAAMCSVQVVKLPLEVKVQGASP